MIRVELALPELGHRKPPERCPNCGSPSRLSETIGLTQEDASYTRFRLGGVRAYRCDASYGRGAHGWETGRVCREPNLSVLLRRLAETLNDWPGDVRDLLRVTADHCAEIGR